MDQTADLMELKYILSNISFENKSSIFNFSETTALLLFRGYIQNMFTLSEPMTIILILLYIPKFLGSLMGNTLAVFVVLRNPPMRRVKNIFLVNLAISDLAVTITCMPMVLGQSVFRLWVYESFICKLTGYMQGVSVTCGIFTLCALSIDRYLSIQSPTCICKHRIHGKAQTVCMLIIIWLLAITFIAPILLVRQIYAMTFEPFDISVAYCIEQWPKSLYRKVYAIFLFITTYLVPIFVISVYYILIGKNLFAGEFERKTSVVSSSVKLANKKVARMLVALIVVFVVSWLPYNILSLDLDLNLRYVSVHILPFTLWIGHAHSAINPILYWFLNPSFRHCMRKALRCRKQQSTRRNTASPQFVDLGDILRLELRHKSCSAEMLKEQRCTLSPIEEQFKSDEAQLPTVDVTMNKGNQIYLDKQSTSDQRRSTPSPSGQCMDPDEQVVSVLMHHGSELLPTIQDTEKIHDEV